MTALLIVPYLTGGGFELAGIMTVAFDVRDDCRRARIEAALIDAHNCRGIGGIEMVTKTR